LDSKLRAGPTQRETLFDLSVARARFAENGIAREESAAAGQEHLQLAAHVGALSLLGTNCLAYPPATSCTIRSKSLFGIGAAQARDL
jgi:hypothetical protein